MIGRFTFTFTFVALLLRTRSTCSFTPPNDVSFSAAAAIQQNVDGSDSARSVTSSKSSGRVRTIPYITTVSTSDHLKAISTFVRPEDTVLELGSQLDKCTQKIKSIIQMQGHGIFVDVARTETNSGRSKQGSRDPDMFENMEKFPNMQYIELEQFNQWKTVLESRTFDVLILDVAMLGNDLTLTAMQVIFDFINGQCQKDGNHRPRTVIVKSKSINSLARRLIHSQRLEDGTVQKDLTRRAKDGKPYIIAAVGVEEYRRSIPHVITQTDECVEIGCFSGMTTQMVDEVAKYCIGVDIGPKIITRAKKEWPQCHFEVGDGWNYKELLRMKQNKLGSEATIDDILSGYDVLYADIGGLSGPDGTLESLSLIDGLSNSLEPRCIVIKSLCMRRLASSLRSFTDIEKSF